MLENKTKPLLSSKQFIRRIALNFLYASILLVISLGIGIFGYHWICKLSWIDSLLNSSMILTGMGPVNPMTTTSAKLFASFYAIFSGVAFLTTVGVMLTPVVHRFIHKFHLEDN